MFLLVILLPACDFENPYYSKLYGSWTCNGKGISLAADTYYRDGKFTRYHNENKKMIYAEGSFTLEDSFLKIIIKRTASRVKAKTKELLIPIVIQYKINRLSTTMLDFKSASENDKPLYQQPQQTCRKVNEQRIGFFYASAQIGRLQQKRQPVKVGASPVTLALSIFNSTRDHAIATTKLASSDVSPSNSSFNSIPDKLIVQKSVSVTKNNVLPVNGNPIISPSKKQIKTKIVSVKSVKNEVKLMENSSKLELIVSGKKDRVVKTKKAEDTKASVARTVIDTNKVVIVVRNNSQQLDLAKAGGKHENVDAVKIKAIRTALIPKDNGRVIITVNKPALGIKSVQKKSSPEKVIDKSSVADLRDAKIKQNTIIERSKNAIEVTTKPSKLTVNTVPNHKLTLAKIEKSELKVNNEPVLTHSTNVYAKPTIKSDNQTDSQTDTKLGSSLALKPAMKSEDKIAARLKTALVNNSISKLKTKPEARPNARSGFKQVTASVGKTIVSNLTQPDKSGASVPEKTVENLIKHQNLLGQQIKFLDSFQRDRNRAYDTLRSLSLAMVPGLNLKSISQKKSTFLIRGHASSRGKVKSFVKRLSRSPHVKKIRIKRITRHKKNKIFLIQFKQAHSVKSYEYLYIRPAVLKQNVFGAGRRIRELRTIRDRLLKRFPNETEAKLLVRKLKWKAKKVGLRIISFKQKKDNRLKDHIVSQIRIVAVGDYDSIVVFLNRLGRRKHVNQVRNLQLHVQNDITNTSEKFKSLHVSMTLHLFRVPKLQKQRQRIPNLKYRFVKLSPYNRVPYSDDTGIINPFRYIVGRYTDHCNGPLSYEKINKVKLVAVLNRKKKMALLKASNGKIYRARLGTCIAHNTKISRITQKSVIMKTVEVKFGRPTIMVRNIKLQAK